MAYRYEVLDWFLCSERLSKRSVRRAWKILKEDPFDARLGTHKIRRLSAHYGRNVYSVVVEADLRILFYFDGDVVKTLVVGTHDVYQ